MRFLADMGVSQQVVEWLRTNGHEAVHLRDQLPELLVLQRISDPGGPGDRRFEHFRLARFAQVLVSRADAFENQCLIGVAGENEANSFGKALHHLGQKFGAVHARHAQVRDHHVEGRLVH